MWKSVARLLGRTALVVTGERLTREQLVAWLERNGYSWRTSVVTRPADRGATVHVSDIVGITYIVRRAGNDGYRMLPDPESSLISQSVVVTP
jgi:hypothetical protein